MNDTADRLIDEARQLIMRNGYNGFSYADLAARLGIRKPSIHHHFPSKIDLVVATVEQSRALIRAQTDMLNARSPMATDQLFAYTGHWERCIADQSAPFCLAGVLAAELPALPDAVAKAVRGHFNDLAQWLEGVLTLGVEQGTMKPALIPKDEAGIFMAGVYGAMLAARAFDDPHRFKAVVDAATGRLLIGR